MAASVCAGSSSAAGSDVARRNPARTSPSSRSGARDALSGQLVAQRVPVAVHRREVAAAVVRAAGGVDRRVEIDAARGGETPVRLLPRPAHRDRALPGETGAGSASAATCPCSRVSIHGEPARTYRG